MDPTSTQRLVEIEADIKNQGAAKSSRWDKLELFSTSSGLESFLEKAPEGNLETILMKFPFMGNSSDFYARFPSCPIHGSVGVCWQPQLSQ